MIQAAKNDGSNDGHALDVGAQQLATVYARALLDAAESAGTTEVILAELDSFVKDVVNPSPKFEAVLNSALISPEDKVAILDKVLKGRASSLFLSFVKVLAHHTRLDILRSIHWAAHRLFDQMRRVVRVEITAAAPITEQLKGQLTESVRKMIGGSPTLEVRIRPELIGGIVMRVGDTVYDGSISTHLEKLRQQMIDRSVHEIQSRRDRFRSPEGN